MTKKKEKTQITKIRNEKVFITADLEDIKRVLWGCYKQLHTHTFESLDELDQLLKKHKVPQLTQY